MENYRLVCNKSFHQELRSIVCISAGLSETSRPVFLENQALRLTCSWKGELKNIDKLGCNCELG